MRELTPQGKMAGAAALARELRSAGFGDDDALMLDTIEGQTDALDAVSELLCQIADADAFAAALTVRQADLQDRKSRYEERRDAIKRAILAWMNETGLKGPIQRPEGTVSVRNGSPQVIYEGDFDVDRLPDNLVRVKREPDKPAIKAALGRGEAVPGAALQSNVPPTLSIRSK
jgi:hypothetical protein